MWRSIDEELRSWESLVSRPSSSQEFSERSQRSNEQ